MNLFELSKSCPLFQGMQDHELESIFQCLESYEKTYGKQEMIARHGQIITTIGIVLSGSLHIVKDDFWGNRTIITEISKGEIFAEAYACSFNEPLEIAIIANEKTTVLHLHVEYIFKTCKKQCTFHYRLLENLLSTLATKNLLLTRKMEHITKRTTRDKLLSYLSETSIKHGSSTFTIPFNRQQLADFLSVDRSAMSKELGKMQKENIIKVHKNTFQLLIQT
ncbi:MAG: Crp/Fnr family transcriptional regulator [Coprobacillaceae bacterium]